MQGAGRPRIVDDDLATPICHLNFEITHDVPRHEELTNLFVPLQKNTTQDTPFPQLPPAPRYTECLFAMIARHWPIKHRFLRFLCHEAVRSGDDGHGKASGCCLSCSLAGDEARLARPVILWLGDSFSLRGVK